MQIFSVGDILNKRIEQAELNHLIYMVRFDQLVFYIGQSKRDVVTRFWEHLNKPSKLGQLIKLNQPLSLNWEVAFFSLADCRPYVQQKLLFQDQEWEHFDMDMAEKELIHHFRPVANADFNSNPTPLPAHLKGRHLFTADSSTSLFGQATRASNNRAWENKMRLSGWISINDENGRVFWKHQNGNTLSPDQIKPYQERQKIPPITGHE
ncbi:MAG: GIY-YIG nuclease family protein [Chloroflexota bacterium]